jgi:hypothetical protein
VSVHATHRASPPTDRVLWSHSSRLLIAAAVSGQVHLTACKGFTRGANQMGEETDVNADPRRDSDIYRLQAVNQIF